MSLCNVCVLVLYHAHLHSLLIAKLLYNYYALLIRVLYRLYTMIMCLTVLSESPIRSNPSQAHIVRGTQLIAKPLEFQGGGGCSFFEINDFGQNW